MNNASAGNKKLLPFYILRILEDYSDADNNLTQAAIIELLDKNYNLTVDRKAVSRNIEWLKDLGYEIENVHGKGYYIIRQFGDYELRLLIDLVRFSKNVPQKDSDKLVERLVGLGSVDLKKKLQSIKYIPYVNKTENRQFFYNIDELAYAISKKKKVAFRYNEIDKDGKFQPIWDSRIIVSPRDMVGANGNYYLVGLIENNDGYTNFRVDRITEIKVLDERIEEDNKFDLKRYLTEHPLMYCGEPVTVKLKANSKIVKEFDDIVINEIVDTFGRNFTISRRDENGVEVVLRANEVDIIDFVIQNACFVELISPDNMRQKLKRIAENLIKKYE